MSVHVPTTSPGVKPVEVRIGARPATSGPAPFFFGGARRSGTTWLAGMLNAHPQIECRNEGWMFNEFGASFPEWIDESRVRAWAARRESRGTWLRDMSVEDALRAMRRAMWMSLVREAIDREGWKTWSNLRVAGDKTTTYFCTQVDEIHRAFPDAKFLHMLRDGRDVVVSDMFLLFRELDRRDMPEDARREATAAREHHIFGRGRPVPFFGPAVLRYLASDWVRCVAGALRARELFGSAAGFHEVRYERIVSTPAPELAAILSWLGVEVDAAVIEKLLTENTFEKLSGGRHPGQEDSLAEWRKGVSGDWRNHFTNDDKALFKSMAGELLVELGYERDLGW